MPQPLSSEKVLEWEENICQQKLSGLPIESWCRQNNVTACSFHYWKKRLLNPAQMNSSSFTELKDQNTGITIECNGISLRLDKHFEPATLKACLALLMELKC